MEIDYIKETQAAASSLLILRTNLLLFVSHDSLYLGSFSVV